MDSAHDNRILYAESTDASGERRTDASDEIITRIMMKKKIKKYERTLLSFIQHNTCY